MMLSVVCLWEVKPSNSFYSSFLSVFHSLSVSQSVWLHSYSLLYVFHFDSLSLNSQYIFVSYYFDIKSFYSKLLSEKCIPFLHIFVAKIFEILDCNETTESRMNCKHYSHIGLNLEKQFSLQYSRLQVKNSFNITNDIFEY